MLVAPPFYACLSIMLICHVISCFTYRDHCPAGRLSKNRVIFFYSFSLFRYLFFYLFYNYRLLWKELFYWNDYPLPIKPIGNSIPVYTIRGPRWEVLRKYGYAATSKGVVFSRFCPLSKIEYDFRGSHGTEKKHLSFQLQTTPNGYKRQKNKRNIYHSNWV